MPEFSDLLIIGQGPAGTAAAKAYREQAGQGRVVILAAEPVPCYSRPRLPEVIMGTVPPEKICLYPAGWYQQQGIELALNQTASRLDAEKKTIRLAAGGEIVYDKLILATGAAAAWPPVNGLPSPRAFVLRTMEDALALREASLGKKNALLIGGGLLGLEAGHALTRLGLRVTVIEIAPYLLPRQLDEECGRLLQNRLMNLGFEFFLGARAERLEHDSLGTHLLLASGIRISADLALMSAGIAPRVELAMQSGIEVGKRGIVVNDEMRTSHPHVFAAGDVAEWHGRLAGLWPMAQAMGRVAGLSAAGVKTSYSGGVPSAKLKIAGIEVWSQGDITGNRAKIVMAEDDRQNRVCKLFFSGGRLIGSIQIGTYKNTLRLKALMEDAVDVHGFEEQLLDEEFQIPK